MGAPVVWWLGARARGQTVIRQDQYLDGWPELSTRFLNTTTARLFGLDSENRSHGSPSSFGWDVKSRSRKCRGASGSIFPTLCVELCLVSFVRSLQFLLLQSKSRWIVGWFWFNHVYTCISIHISVIDYINWYMTRKSKYAHNLCWYFVSGNLDFSMEKSWKSHGTFFQREPWITYYCIPCFLMPPFHTKSCHPSRSWVRFQVLPLYTMFRIDALFTHCLKLCLARIANPINRCVVSQWY